MNHKAVAVLIWVMVGADVVEQESTRKRALHTVVTSQLKCEPS